MPKEWAIAPTDDLYLNPSCSAQRYTLIFDLQAFKSLHHLTHATNQLEEAFGKLFELKKCGLEMGDAMGGRLNDGRTENITIEYDSDVGSSGGWKKFVEKLTMLEDEWVHEATKQ
jgi:hypothetical protein